MTLLLQNLSKRIDKNWIVNNLNLKVNDSECMAILGPSGCGKSTTLRLIAGLDKPNHGQVFINDIDVTNISPVKRRIGMVFQSYALFPHLSVSANLKLGLKIRGISQKEQSQKVNSILSIMHLSNLAKRLPSELSGGQRQRVALARALLRDPLIYLLDEPMSNLDAQLREELRPEIRSLILNGDQPVLYVTHDQQEAMAMADKIALLKDGKIEQVGTPQELYTKPISVFTASFIGRPQINILPESKGIIKAIRPENVLIKQQGIEAKVHHREWFGVNQVLFLKTHLGILRLSCESNKNVSDHIHIGWEKIHEHHFNAHTKMRITNDV